MIPATVVFVYLAAVLAIGILARTTALRSGSVPHQCDPSTRPHRLMVCVIKSHVTAVIFEALANLAGERPR